MLNPVFVSFMVNTKEQEKAGSAFRLAYSTILLPNFLKISGWSSLAGHTRYGFLQPLLDMP
jgi:hypothetical protein